MIKQTVLSQTARGGIRPLLLPPSFHSLLSLPLLATFHCSDRNQDDPGKVRQGLMQVGEYGARSRWPRIQKSGLKMIPVLFFFNINQYVFQDCYKHIVDMFMFNQRFKIGFNPDFKKSIFDCNHIKSLLN